MILKKLNLFFLIFIKFFFFTTLSFGSNNDDCRSSSFYIKNISVDLTKSSIMKARSEAETKAKLVGFKRLIKRLTIRDKQIKINNSEISQLVNYLKINKEANSDKRYKANFDICFKRMSVINFFRNKKIMYSETYRETIAVLPIFKGLRGVVIWDKNDVWYKKWKQELMLDDGLVKLDLAEGNFYLNRNLNTKSLTNFDKKLIQNLIKNEKTNSLLLVFAEPVLKTDGKTYLLTYAKFYNKDGDLENTIYRNTTPLKKTSSVFDIKENLIRKEVMNIIDSIQKNWKKDNLINTRIYDEVDLIIPINSNSSTILMNELLFNDKVINVKSTESFLNKGLIKIENEIIYYNKKTLKTFDDISRGLFGSSKNLTYKKNVGVTQKDISIWPFILEELESLPFVLEVNVISLSSSEGRVNVKFMGNKKTFFQAVSEKKIIFKNLKSGQYILANE